MADSKVVIDLTNFKDRSSSRVPEGRYTVVVEDTELAKTKNNDDMINVWYRIVGGDEDGQTIIDRLTLTEKAMFRVVGFMKAIGLQTPNKRLQINVDKFIGKRLQIDVEDGEPYKGRVSSEVRGYMKAPAASAPAASPDLPDEGDDDAGTDDSADDSANSGAGDASGVSDDSDEVDLDAIEL